MNDRPDLLQRVIHDFAFKSKPKGSIRACLAHDLQERL